MRAFRSLLPIFLLLFLTFTTTVSQTQSTPKTQARVDTPVLKKSKVTITGIDPGTLTAGDQVTLQITGKHLNLANFIQLRAKSATAAGSAPTLISVSNADETTTSIQHINDTQLLVYLDLTKIQPADSYLLSLGLGKDSTDPQITVTYPFPINVYGPAASNTSKTSPAPSSSSGQSPFASCLTSSPSLVQAATSQATTGVNCSTSVMTDGEVADNFGHHVSTLYYALQLRVSNQNTQYDFLLRDILITLPNGSVVSGRIKRLAQGVAVKGKSEDRRAYLYNSMQAAGTIYGAAVTLPLSVTFKNIGNLFQGPLEAAFSQIWPDYSVDNVTRFNNAVFDDQNPSIVPKGGIAQPPLYVVALLPKPDGKSADKSNYINMVTVGIEGTFIKQVTLLSLSTSSISFKPQFISPDTVFTPATFDFTQLRKLSEEQIFTISNTGSSTITIHSFKIIPSGKTSTGSSPDFEVDTASSSCGVGANTPASDGSTAFSVAPNASCKIAVRFHPTTPGSITATLSFDGDNLEGSTSVALSGTGIGLILQSKDPNGNSHILDSCAFSSATATNCTISVGEVVGNATVNVYYFYDPTSSTSETLTTAPSSTQPIKGQLLSDAKPGTPTGTLTLPNPTSGSVPVTFSDTTLLKSKLVVNVVFATVPTTINIPSVASNSLSLGMGVSSPPVTVTRSDNVASPVPTGILSYTITPQGKSALPVNETPALSNGGTQLDFSNLAPGNYGVVVNYPGNGPFISSTFPSFNLIVPTAITIGSKPVGAALGAAVAIPVMVSNTCTGAITSMVTFVPTTSAVPSTPSALTSGAGSVTFTPATAGSYKIVATYAPDTASPCGQGSQTASVTLP